MNDDSVESTPIIGHRDLTEPEIELINVIKNHGNQMASLVSRISDLMQDEENEFFIDERSMNIGITHLQNGFMWLTRSVAKPEHF